jgi:drug/metabolite transporter (DMT)-like permease
MRRMNAALTLNAGLYLSVVLIWGTTWIALKLQLGTVPIAWSIAYRFGLSALVLFAWLAWRGPWVRPRGRAAWLVLAQGVCLFCLNFVCFMQASQTLASGLVAVVFSSATLWNALLARWVHGRVLSPRVTAGGALGMVGLVLLFWPELQAGHSSAVGLAWALAGTWCFSVGNLLSAELQRLGLRPAHTNAWGMAVGTTVLVAWCAAQGVAPVWDGRWPYVAALLYLALAGSVVGFTAYLTLVGRLGPEKAAYCTVLFPVVALSVSTGFEGYTWSLPAWLGLVAVMSGNVLVFARGGLPGWPWLRRVGGRSGAGAQQSSKNRA